MFFSLSIGRKDPTHASGNQTRGGGGLHGSHTFAIPNPFKDRHLPLTGAKQKKRWKIKTAKKDTPRLSSPHWHHQRVQKSQEQRPGCDVGGRALDSDRTLLAWGCQVQFPQPLPPSPQRAKTRAKGSSSGFLVAASPPSVGSGSRRRGSSTFGGGNHQPSVRPRLIEVLTTRREKTDKGEGGSPGVCVRTSPSPARTVYSLLRSNPGFLPLRALATLMMHDTLVVLPPQPPPPLFLLSELD